MGFFDDDNDPFEDILNEFFGARRGPRTSSHRRVVSSESEERVIDYIEERDHIYFVFEIPGFKKQDIEIKRKGDTIIVKVKKTNLENIKNYLKDKLSMGVEFQKTIPVRVKKDYEWTFKNGILEVKFKRK
jgi:HSP20 family molecular chaperone IbpA